MTMPVAITSERESFFDFRNYSAEDIEHPAKRAESAAATLVSIPDARRAQAVTHRTSG